MLFEEESIQKVYLAGPMRGYPHNNVQAFRDGADFLRSKGLEVVSPVELDDEVGFDHTENELTEAQYDEFLRNDIIRILSEPIDALVMLDNWEASRGAALEVHVARDLGLRVFACYTGEQIKRPTDYHPPSDENVLEEANRLMDEGGGSLYGHPYDDFIRTARICTSVLDGYLKEGKEVQPWHIPLLMMGVKISRQVNNPTRRNWRTIAGYARTGEMVQEEASKRKEEAVKRKEEEK